MNCYEWRSKIKVRVAATVNYNVTGDGFSESGTNVFEHDNIYEGWTHRELQCEGQPIGEQLNWALRGNNLCAGRSYLVGQLTQNSTMTVTQVIEGLPPTTWEAGLFFETRPLNEWVAGTSLLVYPQYPSWENDPYSVALRNAIDGLSGNYLYAGIFNTEYGPPTYPSILPQGPVGLPWFRDQASGTSADGTLSVSLEVKITLA